MPSEVRNLSQLVEKSVFLSVHFGMLGITRKVKLTEGTADGLVATKDTGVIVTTDADAHYLKAQKTLLESIELDAIRSGDTAIRQWLKLKCLPYIEVSLLVLPNSHLEEVVNMLDNYEKVERPALIRAFIDAYPRLLEESKAKLGSLYDASDYTPIEALHSVFTFDYNVFTFAVPEFLKQTRYYDTAQAKLQEKFHEAAEEITAVMRQTMLDLVTNLQSQLAGAETDGKKKKLTASSLAKVHEFLNTFEARDITNDEALAKVVTDAKALVGEVSIEALRKDKSFRDTMAANMSAVQAQLAGLMVDDSPDRKVRL